MVRPPAYVLRTVSARTKATENTANDILSTLEYYGYGPKAARKWFIHYLQSGILEDTGRKDDYGKTLYSCVWWIVPYEAWELDKYGC